MVVVELDPGITEDALALEAGVDPGALGIVEDGGVELAGGKLEPRRLEGGELDPGREGKDDTGMTEDEKVVAGELEAGKLGTTRLERNELVPGRHGQDGIIVVWDEKPDTGLALTAIPKVYRTHAPNNVDESWLSISNICRTWRKLFAARNIRYPQLPFYTISTKLQRESLATLKQSLGGTRGSFPVKKKQRQDHFSLRNYFGDEIALFEFLGLVRTSN